MTQPSLGVETGLVGKEEATPGTRESCAVGSVHFDLVSESLDYIPVLSDIAPNAMTGGRQRWGTLDYVSHNDAGGGIIIRPRSASLDTLIEWITGNAGGTPILADATDLPMWTLELTKAGQVEVVLVGAKVNTATFRSAENSPLEIELNVIALKGERNPTDLTAWVATQLDAEKPFLHGGLAMSGSEAWLDDGQAGGNVEVRSLEFTLNNNLIVDAYCNSADRRIIPIGVFELTGSMVVPFNATTKGFWSEMISAVKVEFVATWTDADSNTLAATFVVKLDGELPKLTGPEPVWLTLNFHGVIDTSDANCITLVSTE